MNDYRTVLLMWSMLLMGCIMAVGLAWSRGDVRESWFMVAVATFVIGVVIHAFKKIGEVPLG